MLFETNTFSSSATAMHALVKQCFPDSSKFLDVTWGLGAFWKLLPTYDVVGGDIDPAKARDVVLDLRDLPFANKYFDVGVIDPPFLQGSRSNSVYSQQYSAKGSTGTKLSDLYVDGISELTRVCRDGIIVKLQDSVSSSHYIPYFQIVCSFVAHQFGEWPRDVAVVSSNNPIMRLGWKNQKHLRKCQSYLIAYRWGANPVQESYLYGIRGLSSRHYSFSRLAL